MSADSSPGRTLGVIGILVGFLALAGAFLSPWIQDAIDPPAKPLEETAVDFAERLTEAAAARIKGEVYEPDVATVEAKPSRFLFPAIIGLGMVAVGLGLGSLLRSEPKLVGQGAIALGVSAAVVQWSLLIAGALIFILLVWVVLSSLGVG